MELHAILKIEENEPKRRKINKEYSFLTREELEIPENNLGFLYNNGKLIAEIFFLKKTEYRKENQLINEGKYKILKIFTDNDFC